MMMGLYKSCYAQNQTGVIFQPAKKRGMHGKDNAYEQK